MKYLLDTNVCIRYLKGYPQQLIDRFLSVPERDLAVSVITRAEMLFGAEKSNTSQQTRAVQLDFLKRLTTLPFDEDAANIFATIRFLLESQGTPIGAYDMLIAATALSRNLILVTHNVKHFSRIPDLNIEDWEV